MTSSITQGQMLSYTAFDKMGVGWDPSGGVLVRNCGLLLAFLGMANTAKKLGQNSGQMCWTKNTIRGQMLMLICMFACPSENSKHEQKLGQNSGQICWKAQFEARC